MKFPVKRIAIIIVVLVIGGGAYYSLRGTNIIGGANDPATAFKTPQEADSIYVRFDMEAYDSIRANYWASTTEAQLADHFQLSLQKALGSPVVPLLPKRDRTGTAEMIAAVMKDATSTDEKRQIALNTVAVAIYNLPPVGHGELLSKKQETAFRDNVSNVDPNKDLYRDLGLAKGASVSEVEKAAEQKVTSLAHATTSEAKAELAQVVYAQKVLANPDTKDLYDTVKAEPTLWSKIMGKTLYVNLTKVSPTSLIEFGRAVISASTTPGLDSMIIDLRGNVGGSLDFTQAFVGLFIGPNQYAFDLYHQGDLNPQRTTSEHFPELTRYSDIVLLIDGMTQSTAELTSAVMRRFKLAHIVGERTRGWGTVENTFPLETSIDTTQSYTMLLVHSLTLGADNQPIQGNGVMPDIDTTAKGWQSHLSKYLKSQSLIDAVTKVASGPPLE